jgi:hypothetical protein
MVKPRYIISILILICVIVIFGIIYPIPLLKSLDHTDPIIGNWVWNTIGRGYNTVTFESNGVWSWQERVDDGQVVRIIPPWYGMWKRQANGVYSVNQSGSISLWDYNASQDKIYPDDAKNQIYSRVNSSPMSANKS